MLDNARARAATRRTKDQADADLRHRLNILRQVCRRMGSAGHDRDDLESAGLISLALDRGPVEGLYLRLYRDLVDVAREQPGRYARRDYHRGVTEPLDAVWPGGTRERFADPAPGPYELAVAADLRRRILAAPIAHGRTVAAMLEAGSTLREAGLAAGVTESRACQIRGRLRVALGSTKRTLPLVRKFLDEER